VQERAIDAERCGGERGEREKDNAEPNRLHL
jgi:hypothetical protein